MLGKVIKLGINTDAVSVSQRMQRKPGEQVWTEVAQPPTTTLSISQSGHVLYTSVLILY